MQIHVLFFIAFLNLVRMNRADDYGWGECPKVNPVSNFDFNKFSGLWYVIQKFDLSSPCWTYYFVNQNGIRKVIQNQNQTINEREPEKTPGNIGTLEIVNATQPGFMSVRFSDNILGKADYTVYFTDYENYGAIFRCQKVLFGHRRSATILSRQPYLTPSLRNQARAKLISFDIDISSFKSVDPIFCKNPRGPAGETFPDETTRRNGFGQRTEQRT
ncbi:apolipoprotein D [Daphnia magna]|uniref:apolipoprotein D n=1 Tax=Daphnia magna TaxID=35525 RepID=UPI001E1BC9FE|nr:apolipoprotein D [Daphnia magna]XP_045026545.1 apolipoprotein D [Daphnia magna]XP_045026546.1 apolipoprotein D [Daphnia magna]